jgi:hypothetical protein
MYGFDPWNHKPCLHKFYGLQHGIALVVVRNSCIGVVYSSMLLKRYGIDTDTEQDMFWNGYGFCYRMVLY